MKRKLLIMALTLGFFYLNAQTTYNLDWFTGIGEDVDLTIESGDTVIWTWTSANHTVENVPGSSVETFNSGLLGPLGSTFSYTFTVVGTNDYFCGVHGASSMSGTITVEDALSIDEESISSFSITQNPVDSNLNLQLSKTISEGQIIIYNLLGKAIRAEKMTNLDYISLDVSAVKSGLYLISVVSENGKETKRFIKN